MTTLAGETTLVVLSSDFTVSKSPGVQCIDAVITTVRSPTPGGIRLVAGSGNRVHFKNKCFVGRIFHANTFELYIQQRLLYFDVLRVPVRIIEIAVSAVAS